MGMMTPQLAAKAAKQFVEHVLNALPQSLIDRLIDWKTAYPHTPLKYLPLPVRAEVKKILTSALTDSKPPTRPQPVVSPPVPTNGHASAAPANGWTRPAPARTFAQLTTVIGTEIASGRDISITQHAKQQGCYVIGVNGTGKTSLLKTMITSDINAGLGVYLIEPHGDLTAEILGSVPRHRINDIIYLDVEDWTAPYGLNIFEVLEPRNIRTEAAVASFISHTFEVLWSAGFETPRLMQNLRAVTRTLIANPGAHFGDIPLLYSNEEVRARMLANVTNPQILTFWEEYERMNPRDRRQFTESTLNKVTAFLDEPMIQHILAQSRTTINFRYIMDNAKILLIKLSPQFEEASRLIGAVIIGKILMTAFSRADTPQKERKQKFNLYCDEFHRFASSDFATLIAESRKFRISTILSHQALGQLTEQVRAAALGAGSIICFRVSGLDSPILARSYDASPTQTIIGEEPVRAPTADPIGQLVRHGSQNAIIAQFTAEYLLPLETLLKQVSSSALPFEFGCIELRAQHIIEGRRLLNACLAQVMREGRADIFLPPMALFTLGGAADDAIPNVFAKDIKRSLFAHEEFQGFYDSANRYGNPHFLADSEAVAYLLKKHAHRRMWDSIVDWRDVSPGPSFLRMLTLTRQAMEALAREPIMAETGLYQPKYQQRTYTDMEGEISNYLANQENYHAKVKIVDGGEYTIKTKLGGQSLTGDALAERIETVKRHCRALGYTRHYTEVEEELRKRQEFLLGLGDMPDEDAADDRDDPDEPPPGSFTFD
jgi:hypothetical protein